MNPLLKNILAVIAGIAAGWVVNMGLIMLSGSVIPPPDGVDTTNMESLAQGMHLFSARHYIFPFLAHALGSLVGAFVVAKLAANNQMKFALAIGAFFLIGGVMMVIQLPAPLWFEALDLIVAYIPMGWLGGKMSGKS